MDSRNVRILLIHPELECGDGESVIFIDEAAREALNVDWGKEITVLGRNKVKAIIQKLHLHDCNAQVARMSACLLDKAGLTVGDEAMLYTDL